VGEDFGVDVILRWRDWKCGGVVYRLDFPVIVGWGVVQRRFFGGRARGKGKDRRGRNVGKCGDGDGWCGAKVYQHS